MSNLFHLYCYANEMNAEFQIMVFPHLCFRDKYRVVGFEVETMSVDLSEIKFEGDTCNFPDAPRPQAVRSIDCVQVDNMYFYSSDLYSRSMGMQTISFILLTQSSSSLRR